MPDLVTRIRTILDEQERPHRRLRRRHTSFGAPSSDLAEAPPSIDQEVNVVPSGGGLVRRDGGAPSHKVSRKQGRGWGA
ncbi:MAG TPA: hypothetical protein VI452_05890 [Marmoricola sp.]